MDFTGLILIAAEDFSGFHFTCSYDWENGCYKGCNNYQSHNLKIKHSID